MAAYGLHGGGLLREAALRPCGSRLVGVALATTQPKVKFPPLVVRAPGVESWARPTPTARVGWLRRQASHPLLLTLNVALTATGSPLCGFSFDYSRLSLN